MTNMLCIFVWLLLVHSVSPFQERGASLVRPTRVRHVAPLLRSRHDGKQRRKKKEPPSPPPPGARMAQTPKQLATGTEPSTPAARVDKDHLLSVRKQIALVKAYKVRTRSSTIRTSFRKRKSDDSNRTVGKEEDHDNLELPPLPLLFVDGYNVIGTWPRLKKRRDKNDLMGARDLLLSDLVDFNIGRFEVVCVFDAAGAGELKDKEEDHLGVRVVFACKSADEYIEKETKRLQGVRTVWAASNDQGIQVAARAHGANVVSANWLVKELKGSRQAAAIIVDEFNAREFRSSGGRSTLWDALDTKTQTELFDMFHIDSKSKLSRKDREAVKELERQKAAGLLPEVRKAAVPFRRKKAT